jgi:hypothetical protein
VEQSVQEDELNYWHFWDSLVAKASKTPNQMTPRNKQTPRGAAWRKPVGTEDNLHPGVKQYKG